MVALKSKISLVPETLRKAGGKVAKLAVALPVAAGITFVSSAMVEAKAAPETFAPLVEKLLPMVVNISSTHVQKRDPQSEQFEDLFKDFFERYNKGQPKQKQQRKRKATSLGSGFVIDTTGYIVTNNHVIDGASEVSVGFDDGKRFDAEIVGRDKRTDLALLKIDPAGYELRATTWGNSDDMRVGDWLVAIGNPFGQSNTVTAGIVSAFGRDINAGPYDSFIQTDASINRGNSGGPSFNMDGEVIGVNTAILSPSGGSVGIGFAIPSNLASRVISQLKDHGEVRRGWLGVRIQQVTEELALGMRLDEAKGALVSSTTPGGPAEKAGIQKGDIIVTFDGRDVSEMRRLPLMVAETEVGKAVDVVVWRKGEPVTVKVTLDELSDGTAQASNDSGSDGPKDNAYLDGLGLRLSALDRDTRNELGMDENNAGVQVSAVADGSVFQEKGIRAGDVIVEVDQSPVGSVDEVADLLQQAQSEGFGVSTLLVFRGGEYRWVAVRLPKE